MRPLTLLPTLCVVLLSCLLGSVSAYFIVTEPTSSTTWVNGVANPLVWTKGVLDGIDTFDIELVRLSTDGIIFVAKEVPTSVGSSLNIMLQDVPPADDYFLLCLNSTFGVMYSVSSKFTIAAAASSNATAPKSVSAATVTVSGGPNPTALFATTFPPSANGAVAWQAAQGWSFGMVGVLGACLMGAGLALW